MNDAENDSGKELRPRTRLVGAGRRPAEQFGYVNTPIYRGSTVLFPTYHDLVTRNAPFTYGTSGSPTTKALTDAFTELSGAAGTVLAPTGLAAIALALLSVVKAGDHILVVDSIYRPSRIFCDGVLRRLGVETQYFDPLIGAGVEDLFRENTSAVFLETPGSQSFEIPDVPAICELARARGVCSILDNTWATPLFFPPHERGADVAVEAGTKYMSGHSDLLLGLVSANAAYLPQVKATAEAFAMCPGPEDVFLALRGLRSLELRLREAQAQGLEMARWLEARPEVESVLHPAFPSCPGHEIWRRDFLGSSGLFSVLLRPAPQKAVAAMLDGLTLFGMGFSWGGFESLVIPFDCRAYRTATDWRPAGPALRFSIGLEDAADLKDDLARGFERLNAAR